MVGLDAMQKRRLEHDLKAAGLSRREAKLCVSKVNAAIMSGQLRVSGGLLPTVLGWLGLGQHHQAKPTRPAKGELGHVCACGAACACATQRVTSASQCHTQAQREAQRG